MTTYKDLEMNVIRWAEARRIIPNSTPQAQFIKAVSEMGELADGIAKMTASLSRILSVTFWCALSICALFWIWMLLTALDTLGMTSKDAQEQ